MGNNSYELVYNYVYIHKHTLKQLILDIGSMCPNVWFASSSPSSAFHEFIRLMCLCLWNAHNLAENETNKAMAMNGTRLCLWFRLDVWYCIVEFTSNSRHWPFYAIFRWVNYFCTLTLTRHKPQHFVVNNTDIFETHEYQIYCICISIDPMADGWKSQSNERLCHIIRFTWNWTF